MFPRLLLRRLEEEEEEEEAVVEAEVVGEADIMNGVRLRPLTLLHNLRGQEAEVVVVAAAAASHLIVSPFFREN